MSTRRSLDGRPGPVPEIRVEAGSVTFQLPVAGVQPSVRLVVRCDEDGEIWASISADPSPRSM